MSGQIAEFWASLGIKVDPKEIRKVDKFLKDTENRLKKGGRAKTQEAKASDQVVKAAKSEAAAKSAAARVDAAATKTIDQKTRATQRLTKAERERQRVEKRGRGSLLMPTRRVDTSVRDRINSMFPGINTPPIKYSSADRRQIGAAYKDLFDQASQRRAIFPQRVFRGMTSSKGVDTSVRDRINSMFPGINTSPVKHSAADRRMLGAEYEGLFDQASQKKRPTTPKRVLGRGLPTREVPTQTLVESMFPAMGRKPLGVRSDDRRRLEDLYEGLSGRAPRPRNPLARETEALGRIGRNAPSFGQTGRVADHLRRRRVESEVSALGRIGVNRGEVKPVGEALRRYDQSLEDSVQKARRALSDERHSRFVAGRREMMRGNLSNLIVQGQQPRSDISKEMRRHYRQEEQQRRRISNEELKASQQGLQHEKEIERLRRQGRVDQRNANRQNRLTQATPRRHPQDLMRRSGANHSSGNYLRAGGASGAFMRYGVGSLPFIGGAYGFSALNRANQEAQVTRLTTQAVLQGQGYTEQEGIDAFDWLRGLADDIGFSYMDAAQDYNQFLANALGAGVDVSTSQGIFQGLSEYQTAMGTTSYRRKLINNALSQMMGKGVLSMEEVRRQMADSLPGTISLFSEAYAELLGSGETGQAAQARFYQDIATGSIVSAEILPIFARLASERAQPKLGVMKTMSIAEQGRFGSSLSDLMLMGSESGVEEGFAEFWRSATDLMKGAQPIVRGLSGAFSDLMRSVRPFVSVFSELNNVLASFSEYSGIAEKDIVKFGLWAAALATPWGRLAGAMMIVAEVMEDIAWGVQGKGSTVTGDFFDALEGWGIELDTFEKTVLGVAGAFSTLYAAIKAVQGLGGIFGKRDPKRGGGTTTPPAGADDRPKSKNKNKFLNLGFRVATPLAIASGVNNSFEFENEQERFGFYRDPEGEKSWGMPVYRFGIPSNWLGNPETETGLYRDDEGTLRFGMPQGRLSQQIRDILPTPENNASQIPLILRPEEYINYSNEINGEHTRPPFRVGDAPTQGNVEHNVNLDVNVSLDFEDMDSFRRFAEDEVGSIVGNSIERTLVGFSIGE